MDLGIPIPSVQGDVILSLTENLDSRLRGNDIFFEGISSGFAIIAAMSVNDTQDTIKLGAKELRTTQSSIEQKKLLRKNPIYIVCDNILDTYNTGSIFRLADAVAAQKVYLCGITETPPNTRIKKASINTTEWVDWEYCATTVEAIEKLRKTVPNIQIVLVEQDTKSIPFDTADYMLPIALIVSNETSGATKEVLSAVDMTVEMPMFGVNKSLNVMVSLGIVLYQVIQKLP